MSLYAPRFLPEIINRIQEAYGVTEEKALDLFYRSEIGRLFSDDDSGLYGQSALFIFGLF